MVRHANDVAANELRAFTRAVLGMLQRTLPFQHRPAGKIVLRHLREDRAEIDLPIAKRPETPRTFDPAVIAAVHTLLALRTKLRILHMKRLDALMIDVDEREVVELLEDEIALGVENVSARVLLHGYL